MADLSQLVTLSAGGRPILAVDLNDITAGIIHVRDGVEIQAPNRRVAASDRGRRYGGVKTAGETHENGTVKLSVLVRGSTADACLAKIEATIAVFEQATGTRYWAWKPESASYAGYYEIAGSIDWVPKYRWVQFAGALSMEMGVVIPVLPLAQGLPLDIGDPFDMDSLADYTFDAGASSDVSVAGGVLTSVASHSTPKRVRHTARGYAVGDHQETLKTTPGATITSYEMGVELKALDNDDFIHIYVDDNGTNSRLRIDVVNAGVATNRASTNLVARLSNGTAAWVRGRVEGNVVVAEYFTIAPTPMGTPTLTNTYTLAGAEITKFGAAVTGGRGWTWTPQAAAATLDDYMSEPYTYRNQTLPQAIALGGAIPGKALAKADISLTFLSLATQSFGLLAWAQQIATSGVSPIAVVEAEAAVTTTLWSVNASGAARGGSRLYSAGGAGTAQAGWDIAALNIPADDFTDNEIAVEVWGRFLTHTSNTMVATTYLLVAGGTGNPGYTLEYGTTGKTLGKPSSGSVYRFMRLGTVMMSRATAAFPPRLIVDLAVTGAAEYGLDYLVLAPSRSRAASPTAKTSTGYPTFAQTLLPKTFRSDLSGLVLRGPDSGLGGSPIELPPGNVTLLVKASDLIPDDPTSNTATETLAHSGTVHVAVTPRWFMSRSE